MATLDAALSVRGAREVRAIIDLEPVLGELERRAATARPGSGAIPSATGSRSSAIPTVAEPWAWRIGGHHVAIELTMAGGEVIGSAPSFLGSNPATIPSGPGAGSRAIDGEETLARALLAA